MNIGVNNTIPTKPCPVLSVLINHIVSIIKKAIKIHENQNIHFLAELFNKNNPMPMINIANPQSEYGKQSLQPCEEGKKNSMEINPTIATSMEYGFISIRIFHFTSILSG